VPFDFHVVGARVSQQNPGQFAQLLTRARFERRLLEVEQDIGQVHDQAASLASGFEYG
jgi:hypothetical protein